MRRNILLFVAFIALTACGLLAAGVAIGGNPNNAGHHVTICHATGSESNPYVRISPDAEGVISGHVGKDHQDGRDIIPPFDYYNADNVLTHFDGQNWDVEHQAIYFNDCNDANAPTTTETTPPQVVTVTTPGTPGVNTTTPGTTTTINVPTPGPTKTVTKVRDHRVVVIQKIHIKTAAHRLPKTTG